MHRADDRPPPKKVTFPPKVDPEFMLVSGYNLSEGGKEMAC